MNVGELITHLTGLDPSLTVVVSSDAEGNRYATLADVEVALYVEEGNEGFMLAPEDAEEFPEAKEVLGLWPI